MRAMFVAVAVAVLCATSCGRATQLLGPTLAGEGIVIYLDADFAGASQVINVDVPDLGNVEGPCVSGAEEESQSWADCVSSVKVAPGWTATLFRDANYRGPSITITTDAPNLS